MSRAHELLLRLALLGAVGCSQGAAVESEAPSSAIVVPAGFPELKTPADNTPTAERIALGRSLFYDERLSATGDVSCGSCHLQANAFAEPRVTSSGVHGRRGTRNAPALMNLAWGKAFFWDGSSPSLEDQATKPIENPLEMDATLAEVTARLRADVALSREFELAFGSEPDAQNLARALASFVRSLISSGSRHDAFVNGDPSALSDAEKRGEAIFTGERGECFHCHVGYNLTSQGYRNNGMAHDDPDVGRQAITGMTLDTGKFKTPSLRNVALTAPYMHDGSLSTLADVVEHYNAGGRCHPNTDPIVRPLGLSDTEKTDLLAFLGTLTDEAFLLNPEFADPGVQQ
jgi:cytochrome c peroxidase